MTFAQMNISLFKSIEFCEYCTSNTSSYVALPKYLYEYWKVENMYFVNNNDPKSR